MKIRYSLFYFAGIIPLFFFPFFVDSFELPKLIGVFFLTSCFYILNLHSKKFVDIKKEPFFLPFICFLFWMVFTTRNCLNPYPGFLKILIWVFFFIYYYSLINFIKNHSEIIVLIKGFVLFSFFAAIYGILQTSGIDFVDWTFKRSPLSTFGRRNFAAEYLVMIFPYLYTLIFISRKKERFIYLFISVFLFIHLVLTFTRASWIAFVFSSLFFFFSIKKIPSFSLKKIITFLLFFLLISPIFSQVKKFGKGSVKSRILIWKTTLKMSKDHFLTGIGPGNFQIIYPLYAGKQKDSLLPTTINIRNVHNDYLEVLVETGIIGLLLFLWFLCIPFSLYKNISKGKEKILFIGVLTSILAMYINALFSFPFKRVPTLYIFWTSFGILSILANKKEKIYRKKIYLWNFILFIIYFASSFLFFHYAVMANFYFKKTMEVKEKVRKKQMVEKCVKHFPYSIEFNFFAGNVLLYNVEDLNKALYYYLKTISLSPYYSAVYNNLGILYYKKGDFEKAEEAYLKAIKFNPNRAESYNNLGSLYLEKGKIKGALNCFKKCISIKKDFYLAYFNLGVAYYMMEKYKLSENYFKKAIKLKPDFKPALNYLLKLQKSYPPHFQSTR